MGPLRPETLYYLFARAKNAQGSYTDFAALGSTYTLASPPAALDSGDMVAISSVAMNLAWHANGNPVGVTTYTVALTTSPVYPNDNAGNVSLSTCPAAAPPQAFAVGPLLSATRYYLFVRAQNMQGTYTAYTALGSTQSDDLVPIVDVHVLGRRELTVLCASSRSMPRHTRRSTAAAQVRLPSAPCRPAR